MIFLVKFGLIVLHHRGDFKASTFVNAKTLRAAGLV